MEKENLHPSSPAIPLDRAQNVKTSLQAQLLQAAPDTVTSCNTASFHFFPAAHGDNVTSTQTA